MKHFQFIKSKRLALSLGGSLLILGSPSMAQDTSATSAASASETDQKVIIVTAKSREENLQAVPLSITALSTDDLANLQIRDVRDLPRVTPNLSLFAGSGRNDPSAYSLRGLAANTSDERYQGISFFIDGIPLSGQLASLDIENIERVEVIKGPQSATYGRATYSGAINFVTADPDSDRATGFIKARGSLQHSAPEANYYLGASLTSPIVQDALWMTVGGSMFRNGALAKTLDDETPVGREESQVATATLFYKPDETFSIKVRGLYSHDKDYTAAQITQHPREWLEAGVEVQPFARGEGSFLPVYLPDPDIDLVGSQGATPISRDRYFLTVQVTKEVADYQLSYSGGYFRSERAGNAVSAPRAIGVGEDPIYGSLVGTPAIELGSTTGSFPSTETFENTSHQLIILSPSERDIRWRMGAYYFYESDVTSFPLFANDANPTGLFRSDNIENIAAFGGIDWDVTDALSLSAEGRIGRERVTAPPCPTCIFSPTTAASVNVSTDFTPRLTVSYDITPDNMVYALYSKGLKTARFSIVYVNGEPTTIVADPERLANYEIGTKNVFLDGRLTFNLTAFFNRITDQQLVSTEPVTIDGETFDLAATRNVGASDVWGFELDSVFEPIENLIFRGSVGFAKQEFTTEEPLILSTSSTYGFPETDDGSVVLDGKTQANVPAWNGYIGGEYTWPEVFSDFAATFRLGASYRGSYEALLSNTVKVKSAWTVDTRINLFNDGLDFALFGRNIFNNQRATGSGLAGATGPCSFIETDTQTYGANQQCLYSSAPRPAEWGAEVTFRF